MKKITTGVLSLAAFLLLTFGTSFGKSMLAGCCDGSPCCNGSACCHKK